MRVEFKNRYVENEARLLAMLSQGPRHPNAMRDHLLDFSVRELNRLRSRVTVDAVGRWHIRRQLLGIGKLSATCSLCRKITTLGVTTMQPVYENLR